MIRNLSTTKKFAAVGAVSTAVAFAIAPAAMAADGPGGVNVVNTETVQVYMSSTGHIESQRVYEQLALTGNGKVDLRNPIETDGLRNLDGFGGFTVKDGQQVVDTTVDGTKNYRSVSTYSGDLPIDITVTYELDGKEISADDLVGKSGRLQVGFKVVNKTTEPRQVTFSDGKGGEVTRTVQVPVPMVGSLSTTAPSSFTNVAAGGANTAGDGAGGTKMSYTMTLFPPLGSDTAEFGYSADVTDAVVPRVDVNMLPVDPMASPTFKSAADSYKGGADTGSELVAGATEIDSNLLKLRDGAADLLAGLLKLSDGADQLHSGLADEAAPGADKLADGAGQLSTGLGQLKDGADDLSAGTGEAYAGSQDLRAGLDDLKAGAGDLDGGLGKLDNGARQLSEGFNSSTGDRDLVSGSKTLAEALALISGGLDQLAADDGIPAALQGAEDLRIGVDRIRAGITNPACDPTRPTDPANPCGVVQGLQALQVGLTRSDPANPGLIVGSQQIEGGLAQLLSQDASNPGLPVAKGGVDLIQGQIQAALAASGSIDQLAAALQQVRNRFCVAITDPVIKATCTGTLDAILASVNSTDSADTVESLREKLGAADVGLGQVSAGLGDAIGGVTQLHAGASSLETGLEQASAGVAIMLNKINTLLLPGLSNPACDLSKPKDPSNPCGLREGLTGLVNGLTEAVAGLGQLAPGSEQASAGATTLADKIQLAGDGALRLAAGLGQAHDGSSLLADGAGTAAAGSGDLSDGLGQIDDGAKQLADGAGDARDGGSQVADGAGQLADGLGDAADGSGQIAHGLHQAADGAPKLVDGAGRLSTEGMGALTTAGSDTAVNYGQLYATIQAGSERAQESSMAFGAPADAIGLTAYSFIIKGNDGESSRNWARAGVGALALAASGGVLFLRRRFV